ncbi:MAG: peroxidase family protein, partial [Cyanobium sp.]
QFQTHDWFSHGTNQPDHQIKVPVADGDPWDHQRPMGIDQTLDDPTRPTDSDGLPRTFVNTETHWWDASQIYGSTPEMVKKLRAHVDGKMRIEANGFLPLDPDLGIDLVAFPGTWWVGMSMLHTLFVKEHNAICDHLKAAYPAWGDEALFNHARLINAALIAKIHTVEWTPAILPNPATEQAMNVNWWGLLGPDFRRAFGRIGSGEILSGIVGSPTDHHSAPYYLTEEFTSVYRMHPLIPEGFEFYSCETNAHLGSHAFLDGFDRKTRPLTEEIGFANLFYSFGLAHPGAVTLHNYPEVLRNLRKPNGEVFDLASVDILRDRERGVPRYNQFRELIGRGRVKSFEEITSDPVRARQMREVYDNDVNQVDLMIGLYAEDLPPGFGFSETAFWIFILMASRRLKSDRFFTNDYRAEVYTQAGLDWVEKNSMVSVLKRHHP